MNQGNHDLVGTSYRWVNIVAQALESMDIDSRRLLSELNLPSTLSTDMRIRIHPRKLKKLLARSTELSGDPCFGLVAAKYTHFNHLNEFGLAFITSASLKDAFDRLAGFSAFITDDIHLELVDNGDCHAVAVIPHYHSLCHINVDALVCAFVRLLKVILGRKFSPEKVDLARPQINGLNHRYDEAFGCPVKFDTDVTAIYLKSEDVFRPSVGSHPAMAHSQDRLIASKLSQRDTASIQVKLEMAISELLPTGKCSKQNVASKLNLTARTLQNRLSEIDLSYQQLFDDIRMEKAIYFIFQDNIAMADIATNLGFRNSANFSRAFKQWFNCSPTQYRENKLSIR